MVRRLCGFAQIVLEKKHPGTLALFVDGCGGDQNPLPRRSVELAEKYGNELATSAEKVLDRPMRPLEAKLRTAFEHVTLAFERNPTRQELEGHLKSPNAIRARWARRMLKQLDEGKPFVKSYPYAVQAWKLGDQLWIALGGEALVDYSLKFKRKYGPRTWVTSYFADLTAYIPSERNWLEGGYEVAYLYEYMLPADRWARDVEERIVVAVERLVTCQRRLGKPQPGRPAPPKMTCLPSAMNRAKDTGLFTPTTTLAAGSTVGHECASVKYCNTSVALKMPRPDWGGPDAVRQLREEARVAAQFRHPNRVCILLLGEHQGLPFYVMELIEGRNLAQVAEVGREHYLSRLELWSLWGGKLFAAIFICAALRVAVREDPVRAMRLCYVVFAALSGMAVFAMLSKMSWKLATVFAAGCWLVGVVMVRFLVFAPLFYGGYRLLGLSLFGLYLRGLGRELS